MTTDRCHCRWMPRFVPEYVVAPWWGRSSGGCLQVQPGSTRFNQVEVRQPSKSIPAAAAQALSAHLIENILDVLDVLDVLGKFSFSQNVAFSNDARSIHCIQIRQIGSRVANRRRLLRAPLAQIPPLYKGKCWKMLHFHTMPNRISFLWFEKWAHVQN